MTFEEKCIRKTTQSVDVVVRRFVISHKTDESESFNDVLRRLLKIDEEE